MLPAAPPVEVATEIEPPSAIASSAAVTIIWPAFPLPELCAVLKTPLAGFVLKGVLATPVGEVPEIDTEFAKSLGVEDGDTTKMRGEIKENLEREAKRRTQQIVKNQVMDALLKISELDVPKALIEQDQQRLVEMARQDLQQRGVPNAADAPIPAEMFAEQAERRVKLGLVLAELVKTNDLQAKPEQIRAEVDEFAKSYEDPKEVVRWYYSNQQRLAEMEAYVVESNVVEFVLGKARVSDKEVSFEELASATAQA